MTKLPVEILYFSLFIIIFCQNIRRVNTLRCAHSCAFGPSSFGSTDPIQTPCNTIDVNTSTTVCSVLLTINFETSFIRGTLNDKSRLINKPSTLGLSFTLLPTKTLVFINYECATTDDCDQEFIRDTVSSTKWTQINETKLRTDITSLLFKTNPSPGNLTCANNLICPRNQHCYAQFIHNSSASQTEFNNNSPCDSTSPSEVVFDRHFNTHADDQVVTMKIYCNKDGCNEQKTVEQVYNIFLNEFNLPLNYSAYEPIPNGSYRIYGSIKTSIFFFFLFIYLNSIGF